MFRIFIVSSPAHPELRAFISESSPNRPFLGRCLSVGRAVHWTHSTMGYPSPELHLRFISYNGFLFPPHICCLCPRFFKTPPPLRPLCWFYKSLPLAAGNHVRFGGEKPIKCVRLILILHVNQNYIRCKKKKKICPFFHMRHNRLRHNCERDCFI